MRISLRTRYLVREVLLFTALWMIVIQIYFQLAHWSLKYFIESGGAWEIFQQYYGFGDLVLHSFAFGLMFSIINAVFDRSELRRFSIGKIVLLKTFFYLLANTIADSMLILLNSGFDPDFFALVNQTMDENIPVGFAISTGLYYVFFILLFNFLYQITKRIGPGIMLSSILGRYHQPKDERLVFMFLDLKNSTGIAEKLEHKKYSLFIKDCFSFLTNPIYNTEADVYQYVGDEAVLIWPLKKGIKNLNCFRLFFEFRQVLEKKRGYFLENYGILPEFKAGVDYGEVTVTEVGEMRRELAFHGDVLNTAARLEKLCNRLGKDLLISEYLEAELPDMSGYRKEFIQSIRLPGKDHPIKVFSIEQTYLNS